MSSTNIIKTHNSPRNIKVLQVTSQYLPHTGGIERYVYNISTYLKNSLNYSIDIFTSNIPKGQDEIEIIDGITVHRYPYIIQPLRNPIITHIRKLISKLNNYDIIHVHGIYTFIGLIVLLSIKHNSGQKVILTHHGIFRPTTKSKLLVRHVYESIFLKKSLKSVNNLILQSIADKEYFLSLGVPENNISIIPNGIDTVLFKRAAQNDILLFKNKWHISGERVILYLSVISKRKGVFDLIKAFTNIELDDTVLLICGSGPDLDYAKKFADSFDISNRIIFTDRLSFTELLTAYSIASVYVLPSYDEGMPTTIIEALCMGIPVIASDIPSVKDNFGSYVQIITPGNVTQLTDAINKQLNGLYQNKIRDQTNFRELYDIKNVFKKYIDIYLDKSTNTNE